MDVEKTIEFLLQSQAQHDAALGRIEAAQARQHELLSEFMRTSQESHIKLETTVLTLAEHITILTKEEIDIKERQRQDEEKRRTSDALQQETRENLNALIRVVDDIVRRNGGNKN